MGGSRDFTFTTGQSIYPERPREPRASPGWPDAFAAGVGLNFQAAGAKSAFDRLQRLRIGGMMEDLSSMGDLCWKSGFPAVRGGVGVVVLVVWCGGDRTLVKVRVGHT